MNQTEAKKKAEKAREYAARLIKANPELKKWIKEYLEQKRLKYMDERKTLTAMGAKYMAIERIHYLDVLNEIINELFGEESK